MCSQVLQPLLRDKDLDASQYVADKLSALAVKYRNAGRKDKAADILAKAYKTARTLSKPVERADALDAVAVAYAEIDMYDQAVIAAQANTDSYSKVKALTDVAAKIVRIGRDNQAAEIIGLVRDVPPSEREEIKSEGLLKIVDEYLKAGKKNAAMDVLSISFEIAKTIPLRNLKDPL
jgi:tetratricopeptide (TPR) repeat protein